MERTKDSGNDRDLSFSINMYNEYVSQITNRFQDLLSASVLDNQCYHWMLIAILTLTEYLTIQWWDSQTSVIGN
jgi:hypothetical protein